MTGNKRDQKIAVKIDPRNAEFLLYIGRARLDPTNKDRWQFRAHRLVRSEDTLVFDEPVRMDINLKSGWKIVDYNEAIIEDLKTLRKLIRAIGERIIEVNQQVAALGEEKQND